MFRVNKIKFHNFRNIFDSEIDLNNPKSMNNVGGTIIGIYGPNGTSKSSVGYALSLLSKLACGFSTAFFHDFAQDFGIKDDKMSIEYEFDFDVSEGIKKIDVFFEFKKNNKEEVYLSYEKILLQQSMGSPIYYDVDRGEDALSISVTDNQVRKLKELFNEDAKNIYSRVTLAKQQKHSLLLYQPLFMKLADKEIKNNKLNVIAEFTSYIYSKTAFIMPDSYGLSIINSLFVGYGQNDINPIEVISKNDQGIITITEAQKERIENIVEASNAFVGKLIPDFRVKLVAEPITLSNEPKQKYKACLFSIKNDGEFNFENESEGIKRLFFIASSIAKGTNDPNYIVFIDEIDEGIFEVLFGSVVESINDYCKCQVIFTSHNLRPLEILDYHQFIFSTMNENDRFRTLNSIGSTNNLRDVYIRKIIYGDPNIEFGKYVDNMDVAEGLLNASK